jgi:hypothetical protein
MSLSPTEKTDGAPEQQTSRPSSAGSSQDGEHLHFERQLSTIIDDENKQSSNSQPIIWDDPFELLVTNEQTGRIGISAETLPSSPTSRSMMIRKERIIDNLFILASKTSILRTRVQSPKREGKSK